MNNQLSKVYISYKHDSNYDDAIESIKRGLRDYGIDYSIDQESLQYKDNIEEYEKEIGEADRIIMIITPGYFRSLACMFEMTQIFKTGRVKERVFPIVDMGEIPRNGDGLSQVKEYWHQEKKKRSLELGTEPGSSKFRMSEMAKIDEIICQLDNLWMFIVHVNTESIDKLTRDNATMLIATLKRPLSTLSAVTKEDESPLLSRDVKPAVLREVRQHGDKSIYIEQLSGDIIVN